MDLYASGRVDLTNHLRLLANNDIDLMFGERRRGEQHGELIFQDRLVLYAAPVQFVDLEGPVPLVTYPAPSLTREIALDVLRGSGRGSRITCTTDSLNGLRAAALAGLGVVLHAESLPPHGLEQISSRGLPDAGDIEFVLVARRRVLSEPESELREVILMNVTRLRTGSGR